MPCADQGCPGKRTGLLNVDVRLQEGTLEAEPQAHGVETVGYLAMYAYNSD